MSHSHSCTHVFFKPVTSGIWRLCSYNPYLLQTSPSLHMRQHGSLAVFVTNYLYRVNLFPFLYKPSSQKSSHMLKAGMFDFQSMSVLCWKYKFI